MTQACWNFDQESGFLLSPDPIKDLRSVPHPFDDSLIDELMVAAASLPQWLEQGCVRTQLMNLPDFSMTHAEEVEDFRVIERLFQIYAHFANAFVWCDQDRPSDFIPKSVAVPLVALSKSVQRPPILPYASTSLANFERIDAASGYQVDNLRCLQKMIDIEDESWFHLVHVEIEAHAGQAISALLRASKCSENQQNSDAETELETASTAIQTMTRTFRRILEKCSTEIYFFTLRPYLFGFDNVVYDGVTEFDHKPMSFRGESGAQSSVIPAIRDLLGLQHAEGGLSQHLLVMQSYMPKPHRDFLASIDTFALRRFVGGSGDVHLRQAYNSCLSRLVEFRSLHLRMAHAFIAQKVESPRGTGGTEFMKWLAILRDETKQQFLSH